MKFLLQIFFILFSLSTYAQDTITLMTYNVLNFSANDITRASYFKTVIDSIQPDILVCQEMQSLTSVDAFHTHVLENSYKSGIFIDGPGSDNAIFFKENKFKFLKNKPIPTELRDINEFSLVHKSSGDTIYIYSVHLKASQGSSNLEKRFKEIEFLRSITNTNHPNRYSIVAGDFNIYDTNEPAYLELTRDDGNTFGHFVDPVEIMGVCNNPDYAPYHTQSTRTRQFGGGASGGLDDRFDMILFSKSLSDTGSVRYVNGSTWAVGNFGDHYNDSINNPDKLTVSQTLADALHYASDHLPLVAKFVFEGTLVGVDQSGEDKVSCFPNPTNGKVNINVTQENFNICVFDALGAQIYSTSSPSNQFELDLSNNNQGIYILRITTPSEVIFNKIIVVEK